MRHWSREEPTGELPITAEVAKGTEVPMWILGSTANGARLAAQLGMPFSVASHFAPFQYLHALQNYREKFVPRAQSASIVEPRPLAGVIRVVTSHEWCATRHIKYPR